MTVACGFAPAHLAAHPASGEVRSLPLPAAPEFLDAGLQLCEAPGADPILLVYPATAENRRRVNVLRSASRDPRVRALAVPRPLTGLAAATAVIASLGGAGHSAGAAAGYIIEQAGALLPTYAITSSVSSVDLPMVRVVHHLTSWVPGTYFGIALDEHPRIGNGPPTANLAQSGGDDLIVNGQERLAERLAAVTPAHVVERIVQPDAPDGGPRWWGNASFFEHTVVPRDLSEVSSQIRARPLLRCNQCGENLIGPCPFCTTLEAQPA